MHVFIEIPNGFQLINHLLLGENFLPMLNFRKMYNPNHFSMYCLYVYILWNEQGSPQFIILEFPSPVSPAELQLQFHGGFSGQSCHLEVESDDAGWTDVMKFYPQDCSSLQVSSL